MANTTSANSSPVDSASSNGAVARSFYMDLKVQVFVAILIITNFLTSITEKEIDPRRRHWPNVWMKFDTGYNLIFTLELMINMYGFWMRPFWGSGWNIFDVFVVSISLLDLTQVDLPGGMKLLRTLRAFRVFRLFKRVKELQKILVSLMRAIPGVLNAFVIMFIVMSIYAIIGVEFFQSLGLNDVEDNKSCDPKWETQRRNCFGDEYFGCFSRSLYSLFQILTGESWSEAIVRFTLFESEAANFSAKVNILFFLTFIIFNAVILVNVVVAVLLDKFLGGEESLESPENTKEEPAITLDSRDLEYIQAQAERIPGLLNDMEEAKSQAASIAEMLQRLSERRAAAR